MSLGVTRRFLFLLLAAGLTRAPASAADAPPADGPRPLAKLAGPCDQYVRFSGDGRRILTAGAGEARLWDAQTFRPVSDPIRQKGLTFAQLRSAKLRLLSNLRNGYQIADVIRPAINSGAIRIRGR